MGCLALYLDLKLATWLVERVPMACTIRAVCLRPKQFTAVRNLAISSDQFTSDGLVGQRQLLGRGR